MTRSLVAARKIPAIRKETKSSPCRWLSIEAACPERWWILGAYQNQTGVCYSSFLYEVRDTSSTTVFCSALASSCVSIEMLFKNTVPRSSMTLVNISGVKPAQPPMPLQCLPTSQAVKVRIPYKLHSIRDAFQLLPSHLLVTAGGNKCVPLAAVRLSLCYSI